MARSARRLRRGASLIEVVTASTISVLVLTATVLTMFVSSAAWIRGQSRIEAEGDAQKAVRAITQQLREAWQVVVDANGQGLTYIYPLRDATGAYVVPPTSDGVARRIELQGTNIVLTSGGQTRILARGVITTDPQTTGGTGPYRIFTAGAGSVTRQVTVQVVTRRLGNRNQQLTSRNRETIFLRNVPELTR